MVIKKHQAIVAGLSVVAFAMAGVAFAATGSILTNGGVGQVAGNSQSFGVAVCNGGTTATSLAVPVLVSANGASVTASSEPSIQPDACAYTYVDYSQFGMTAGQTYSVVATIDPGHTVIKNSDNAATYTVTMPSAQMAAAAGDNTVADQSTNFLATIGAAFVNFFASLRNLF